MRLPRSFSLLLSLPLISLIVFSGASIDAHAYSGGRYLTPNESLQVFGSVIPFKFYNGSGYTDAKFTYNSTVTITSSTVHSADGSYTYEGTTFLEYRASANSLNTNPSYITVDIQPTYSIFDTTQIHSIIALSDGNSTSKYLSSATYQSPAWDWMFNGSHVHIENSDESAVDSGYYAYFTNSGRNFTYVCADLSSQSLASGYSYRATFCGNQIPTGSYYRLLIGVPYVDSDSSAAAGTSVSGGSGGSGSSIDLSETNEELQQQTGILSTISNWLSSFFTTLGNTVLSWFMPSQNFLSNWVTRIKGILYDHLSPWGDMDDTISNVLDRIVAALGEGGVESVEFPALSVPGTDFSTQSISVPLWPSGSSSLQYWVKLAVNLVSTIWVCNMILNKIKSKILGESVVEVEELENNDN